MAGSFTASSQDAPLAATLHKLHGKEVIYIWEYQPEQVE